MVKETEDEKAQRSDLGVKRKVGAKLAGRQKLPNLVPRWAHRAMFA